MRGLRATFSAKLVNIYRPRIAAFGWYDPQDYSTARKFGSELKEADEDGMLYASVRDQGKPCYALLTPHLLGSVVQTGHYEYQWDGTRIANVYKLAPA